MFAEVGGSGDTASNPQAERKQRNEQNYNDDDDCNVMGQPDSHLVSQHCHAQASAPVLRLLYHACENGQQQPLGQNDLMRPWFVCPPQ